MTRPTRIVSMALALLLPVGGSWAYGQSQVSVQADIDIIDPASVLAFSARVGNLEVRAGSGWVAMSIDQRRAFVQAHPNLPPTVINKDWDRMTIIERGEVVRVFPTTRRVLLERWDRATYDDHEAFYQQHPEARRRLERVHGRGWHGGKHGSHGRPGERGGDGARSDDRGGRGGDGKDARDGGDDKDKQNQDQGDGRGEGKGHGKGGGEGKGHKHGD